jgi:hypothetical protein
VSALARATGVSFAAAHRELEAMKAAGLAVVERQGIATVYRADAFHPQASLLRSLLAREDVEKEQPSELLALLQDESRSEDAFADALVLAHRKPELARDLPVALWDLRDSLDYARLRRAATRRDERHGLGLFLDLASYLGAGRRPSRFSGGLRDGRKTAIRDFFVRGKASVQRTRDEQRLAVIGRRWGFVLNADLGAFVERFQALTRSGSRSGRRTAGPRSASG